MKVDGEWLIKTCEKAMFEKMAEHGIEFIPNVVDEDLLNQARFEFGRAQAEVTAGVRHLLQAYGIKEEHDD